MKRLVLALYAQCRVGAEFEETMGARNGIRQRSIFSRRPILVNKVNKLNLRFRIKPIMWLKLRIE